MKRYYEEFFFRIIYLLYSITILYLICIIVNIDNISYNFFIIDNINNTVQIENIQYVSIAELLQICTENIFFFINPFILYYALWHVLDIVKSGLFFKEWILYQKNIYVLVIIYESIIKISIETIIPTEWILFNEIGKYIILYDIFEFELRISKFLIQIYTTSYIYSFICIVFISTYTTFLSNYRKVQKKSRVIPLLYMICLSFKGIIWNNREKNNLFFFFQKDTTLISYLTFILFFCERYFYSINILYHIYFVYYNGNILKETNNKEVRMKYIKANGKKAFQPKFIS
jgi:hypothetical protein